MGWGSPVADDVTPGGDGPTPGAETAAGPGPEPIQPEPIGPGEIGSEPIGRGEIGSEPIGPGEVGSEPIGPGEIGSADDELPALEQWPEDEGSAPHARSDFPSIGRLLLRATPRVLGAMVLAFLYAGATGSTRVALLLCWLVVVGSMLMPRWRRYVETGERPSRRRPS